jgi:hypothetical protein
VKTRFELAKILIERGLWSLLEYFPIISKICWTGGQIRLYSAPSMTEKPVKKIGKKFLNFPKIGLDEVFGLRLR